MWPRLDPIKEVHALVGGFLKSHFYLTLENYVTYVSLILYKHTCELISCRLNIKSIWDSCQSNFVASNLLAQAAAGWRHRRERPARKGPHQADPTPARGPAEERARRPSVRTPRLLSPPRRRHPSGAIGFTILDKNRLDHRVYQNHPECLGFRLVFCAKNLFRI